jgi:hypothetical protein
MFNLINDTLVNLTDILYVELNDDYVNIVFTERPNFTIDFIMLNDAVVKQRIMAWFENLINRRRFFRVFNNAVSYCQVNTITVNNKEINITFRCGDKLNLPKPYIADAMSCKIIPKLLQDDLNRLTSNWLREVDIMKKTQEQLEDTF